MIKLRGKGALGSRLILSALLFSCSDPNKREESFLGSGTIEAREVVVSSPAVGEVLILKVDEGDEVRQGELIAQIDVERLILERKQVAALMQELALEMERAKINVRSAEVELEHASREMGRIEKLYGSGSATEQQKEDAENQFTRLKNALEAARLSVQVLLAKRVEQEARLDILDLEIGEGAVSAPCNGTILTRYVEEGELVSRGMPIAKIADLSTVHMRFYLSVDGLIDVKLGDSLYVLAGGKKRRILKGAVTWISPQSEFIPKNVETKEARADLVYAVKISLRNTGGILKIGQIVDVYKERPF